MKTKAAILILFAILLGCKKSNNLNLVLNGVLTDCPSNYTCSYDYFDNADFINGNQPVPGNYRVFWYKSVNTNVCDATTGIYFKTSLSNNEFDISSTQIAAGQIVAYDQICPCCDYATVSKPIGGEIKGKRTDANRWLINATIVFGVSANNPVDTLTVNQYFTMEKLP